RAAHDPGAFDVSSLDEIRKANAGRPFVLAFWSVHCEPCQRDMPLWSRMRDRHPGVAVVLVATDPPAEHERVKAFLTRFDPGPVERRWFSDDFEERTRYAVDPKWRGELPRTYFFDARHQRVVRSGALDAKWVEGWFA